MTLTSDLGEETGESNGLVHNHLESTSLFRLGLLGCATEEGPFQSGE